MNDTLLSAINDVENAPLAYTKFITPNDTGKTGGHQAGFHIHMNAWMLFFDKPGIKGENTDLFITVKWQNDFETSSRIIYYGKGTRNEYRLTRFGRGFPFLSDDNIGNLLVLCKKSDKYFNAYVLTSDDDIETFLSSVGLDVTETNKVLKNRSTPDPESDIINLINQLVSNGSQNFPPSKFISETAQKIWTNVWNHPESIIVKEPDKILLDWVTIEYQLFKAYEKAIYNDIVVKGFKAIEDIILLANTLLNRRKSRAGKSLENHLSQIFLSNKVEFETQVKTEDNKKPDFIFPGGKSYHNPGFNVKNLFFLAAKTTCKDRWRQILNEADRIKFKHLFTLQQGISKNQLDEMKKNNVILVVPKPYKKSFPEEKRNEILSLTEFLDMVKSSQKIILK